MGFKRVVFIFEIYIYLFHPTLDPPPFFPPLLGI